MPKDVLEVRAWDKTVGAVAYDPNAGTHVFEYDPAWLRGRVELSPFMMPTTSGRMLHHFPALPHLAFNSLPGMLADALPGDFGSPIVNTWMASHGFQTDRVTSLDRLAFLGKRGIGALEFRPSYGSSTESNGPLRLSILRKELDHLQRKQDKGEVVLSGDIRHLIKLGSVAGGATPKAVIGYNPTTQAIRSGQFTLPAGFEHWLVKFDDGQPCDDLVANNHCRVEYAYNLMAKEAGVVVPQVTLHLEDGVPYLLTRRFDRENNRKIHVQSLAALLHLNYRSAEQQSYDHLFRAAARLDLDVKAESQIFLRMAFNLAGHNCCDHAKNFAFMLREGGEWELAPDFDLTYSLSIDSSDPGRHTMAINGKHVKPRRDDLLEVAERFRVKGARDLLEQVNAAVKRWPHFARAAGLDKETIKHIAASHRVL